MDHRIPKVGAVISLVLAIGALITFLFLNQKFEGPDPAGFLRNPKQLSAKFENTKKLPTKQPVLFKGISVGRVNRVDWDPEQQVAEVFFTLDDDFDIHGDGVVQVGERSLLGDPFLNVLSRGSENEPVLEAGDEVTNTRTSVNFDEALDFLDEEGRRDLKSLITTFADGTSRPGNGERLNGTIGGGARTVSELRALTRSLHGQEEQIARLVSGASTVLSEIGRREQAVRTIVGSGRRTLDALASNTASLDRGIAELPRLLDAGRRSLAAARPLVSEARPLTAKLRAIAPDLNRAFDAGAPFSLNQINRQLIPIIEGLRPLRKIAVPVLGETLELNKKLQRLVKAVAPVARSLVPGLDYLTPRASTITGLYGLLSDITAGRDDVSHYVRVGLTLGRAEQLDLPPNDDCAPGAEDGWPGQDHCNNPYPGPEDALDPQPFEPPYPRLLPCAVPPRSTPTAPCE